jgi:hypothetical protein
VERIFVSFSSISAAYLNPENFQILLFFVQIREQIERRIERESLFLYCLNKHTFSGGERETNC